MDEYLAGLFDGLGIAYEDKATGMYLSAPEVLEAIANMWFSFGLDKQTKLANAIFPEFLSE